MNPASRSFKLVCHSDSDFREECSIDVDMRFQSEATFQLIYRVSGDVQSLRIPEPAGSKRKDNLWRHTCFEIFLSNLDGAYYEFNFSPSTQWATYRFDSYRRGMKALQMHSAPRVSSEVTPESLLLTASVDLRELPDKGAVSLARMALAAVVKNRDGDFSYWALRHPAGKPDFHHADGFVAVLTDNDG